MQYLISYLAVGLLLAVAATLHNVFPRKKALIIFPVALVLWPLLVLIAPESFLRSHPISTESDPFPRESLQEKLAALTQAEGSPLTEDERRRLTRIAKYGEDQITLFGNNSNFEDILGKYWNSEIPPAIYHSYKQAILHLDEQYDPETLTKYRLAEPDWYIGFSIEFLKSIAKADRKKQGRILEAIGKISAAPVDVYGDTIKPLSGNLAGLWRCRLGDDRLIYYPDAKSKKVVLISFGSRGEAYSA
jgi:mRNA-degrading endonuclease RelE of RelBE toxin-antitoxin system